MGGAMSLFGVIGADDAGAEMLALLESDRASLSGIVSIKGRPSTVKTRIVARSQHMLRFDEEETGPLDSDTESTLITQLGADIPGLNVLVISDYNKGVITEKLARAAISTANAAGVKVLVDPKPANINLFAGADLIKP